VTSPTVLSLFYLNLKKDKKLHIKSLPQVRFTKRWELIGRAVFEWVREVIPGLYYSIGVSFSSELIPPWRGQQPRMAAAVAAKDAPLDDPFSGVTVGVASLALFEKEQVIVAQLHLHWHQLLLIYWRQVLAINESQSTLLHSLEFLNVAF